MRKIFLTLGILFATIWFISCGSEDNTGNNNNNDDTYTIYFNGNGGSNPANQSGKIDAVITLPSSSQEGWVFNGWWSAKEGGVSKGKAGDSYKIIGSTTLYAQWNKGKPDDDPDDEMFDNNTTDDWESKYPLHSNILATTFWAGEGEGQANGNISNVPSAWDYRWGDHYTVNGQAKEDAPNINRDSDFFPVGYNGTENVYYFALPYNDADPMVFDGKAELNETVKALNENYEIGDNYDGMSFGKTVVYTTDFRTSRWQKWNAQDIPWYDEWESEENKENKSAVKARWVRVRSTDQQNYGNKGNGEWVYAQWLDAGPFFYDDFDYVFGDGVPANQKPGLSTLSGAGIDLSPAVMLKMGFSKSELGTGGTNRTVEWQFVDTKDVPKGPWRKVISNNLMEWEE